MMSLDAPIQPERKDPSLSFGRSRREGVWQGPMVRT